MTDFTTIRGVDGYRQAFPEAFINVSDDDVKKAVGIIHSSVLEGYTPDLEDAKLAVRAVVDTASARMTRDELIAYATAGGKRRRDAQRSQG